jgi:glycosyltransferase involved in cell wall biosynthesis
MCLSVSKNRRRILYLCADTGVPYWGSKGGSIHVREIVKAMTDQGYDVRVVAAAEDGDDNDDSSVEIHNLPRVDDDQFMEMTHQLCGEGRLYREVMEYYRNWSMEKLLRRLDARASFDYVYERYSLFGIAGLRFARRSGIPFVLEVNAPLVAETSRYRRLILTDLATAVESRLFNGADHIIAVSEELKRYILEVAPRAGVSVVPNGVRIEHFQGTGKPDSDIELPGIEDGDFVVGFMGSLKPWHGVEILIESFAEFSAHHKNAKLLIVGGRSRSIRTLETKCRGLGLDGRVLFTGAVSYEAIPPLLNRTDVLVAPYPEVPGFYFSALKVFEYMAMGKAIVASHIGQIPEILSHEKTALLVSPGDSIALRQALGRLKQDSALRKVLGRNALAEARDKHTWIQRTQRISAILEELGKTERTVSKLDDADSS